MNELNRELFGNIAMAFEAVLESNREEEIHAFLAKHPFLLKFLNSDGFIKSKFRLADAYIPDFVSVGEFTPPMNDPRPLVSFIEIERANMPLFTKKGDPTSFLTHAIRQVQDWKKWVTDNRSYFHTVLLKLVAEEIPDKSPTNDPFWRGDRISRGIIHGFHDEYIVIAGRRHTMNMNDRLRLSQMNDDLHNIRIVTYDVLLELVIRAFRYGDPPPYWYREEE